MRCHKLYITKIQLVISPKETNVVSCFPIMCNWKILEVLWSLTLKEMPQEFSLSLIWNWIAPQERLGFKLWCFHVTKIQKKQEPIRFQWQTLIDLRLLHFLRVQWQCDWKSKIKNQNFFFWAILDLQKLFELSWNLSVIVATQIISFCSLDYCLEWDLIWIEFEPPSISPHVMEHKKCGGNKKVIRFSFVLFDTKVCIWGFLNVILGNITQFFYRNILSYKRGIVQISNKFQYSRQNGT